MFALVHLLYIDMFLRPIYACALKNFIPFPFRETGSTGTVFALLFDKTQTVMFQQSPVVIGQGLQILNPVLEGEWAGGVIVSSPEPCLARDADWSTYVPDPLPQSVSAARFAFM